MILLGFPWEFFVPVFSPRMNLDFWSPSTLVFVRAELCLVLYLLPGLLVLKNFYLLIFLNKFVHL